MALRPYLRKVQFYETDGMGVVYHGNYIHWMEEARTDFLDQLGFGYERMTEQRIDCALTDISCSYRKVTTFGQTLAVYLNIETLTPARMTLSYRMVDAESGALHTLASSSHFFYDRQAKRPVALKKKFPELYAMLQDCTKSQEQSG